MLTKKQEFRNYISWLIKDKKIDKTKAKDLIANAKTEFNEWQTTWTIWSNYLSTTPKVIDKSKIDTPKIEEKKDEVTWTLWQTSKSNAVTEKFEDTLWAYSNQAKKWAEEKKEVLMDNADKQTEIIKDRDSEKLARSEEEKDLAEKKAKLEEDNAARAREDAAWVFKRQEDIANRQAQIAWAWLWQSGLKISEADMQWFKNDIIAKYGENISNAEQFKAKTNMDIDKVLSESIWDLFNSTQEINRFKDSLADAEFAPVLNALTKVAEWDTQAIDDVTTFYKSYQTKKADEEYGRVAEQERIADDERSWQEADNAKKLALLQSQFKKEWVPIAVMDIFIWNPDKFKGKSYAEAVNMIQKDIDKKWDKDLLSQIYITIKNTWKEAPKWLEDSMERIWLDYEEAKLRFDRTNESKQDAKWDTFNSDEITDTIWWKEKTQTFNINTYTKGLDKYITKHWKEKVLKALKDKFETRKVSKKIYDAMIEYINKE